MFETFSFAEELIAPAVLALFGVLIYAAEKWMDRRHEIAKEKRAAFADFTRAIEDLANYQIYDTHEERGKAIVDAKKTLNELSLRAKSETFEKLVALEVQAREFANICFANRTGMKESVDGLACDDDAVENKYIPLNAALCAAVNAARGEFGLERDELPLKHFSFYSLPAAPDTESSKKDPARAAGAP